VEKDYSFFYFEKSLYSLSNPKSKIQNPKSLYQDVHNSNGNEGAARKNLQFLLFVPVSSADSPHFPQSFPQFSPVYPEFSTGNRGQIQSSLASRGFCCLAGLGGKKQHLM
jgi:hypothetical protein